MTDEEKKELGKLSKDELIDLLGEYKEDADRQRAADRKAIVEKFFGHSRETVEETDDAGDAFDLSENKAFQNLKKKFQ